MNNINNGEKGLSSPFFFTAAMVLGLTLEKPAVMTAKKIYYFVQSNAYFFFEILTYDAPTCSVYRQNKESAQLKYRAIDDKELLRFALTGLCTSILMRYSYS